VTRRLFVSPYPATQNLADGDAVRRFDAYVKGAPVGEILYGSRTSAVVRRPQIHVCTSIPHVCFQRSGNDILPGLHNST